jgi:hypothetical protein
MICFWLSVSLVMPLFLRAPTIHGRFKIVLVQLRSNSLLVRGYTELQHEAPDSRIVYVDNDHCKSGCAHARWAVRTA